jgi:hypothetical protein
MFLPLLELVYCLFVWLSTFSLFLLLSSCPSPSFCCPFSDSASALRTCSALSARCPSLFHIHGFVYISLCNHIAFVTCYLFDGGVSLKVHACLDDFKKRGHRRDFECYSSSEQLASWMGIYTMQILLLRIIHFSILFEC